MEDLMVADGPAHAGASTPGKDDARSSITRTTITPAPGSEAPAEAATAEAKRSWLDRLRPATHGELAAAQEPYGAASILRFTMATMLAILCLLTVGGAILMLLLWQQERASGVLTSQLDRTWDLFDMLRQIERWLALATIPVAVAWIAVATVNVRRGTGQRRSPIVAALSLPFGLLGIWIVGSEIVAEADDALGEGAGFVLQAIFIAVPLIMLERVTSAAEAKHRPLRVAAMISVCFLAQLQFLGGLSTIDQTSGSDEWGRLGAYMVIGGLLQVLGALAVNEAARSIEDGTQHRYTLRNRFGESLLAEAER